MAQDGAYNPSGYEILRADLTPFGGKKFDVQNAITKIDFTQGLDSLSYQATIEILDNTGLLENLPIRGEENLDLHIKTSDIKTEIKLKLFVYAVSDIKVSNDATGVMYNLKAVSRTSHNAGTKTVTEAFNLKSEKIVKKIFQDHFAKIQPPAETLEYDTQRHPILEGDSAEGSSKNLWIQPSTSGKLECIIPKYLPGKAMDFVAKRSFNSNTPSQYFRFFETWDGYYFVTDEFLTKNQVDKAFQLFYNPAAGSLDPTNPAEQLNKIEEFKIVNRGTNTGTSLYNGAYASRVKEIDLVRRKVTNIDYEYLDDGNYLDMTGEKADNAVGPHSEEFIRETFTVDNGKDMIVYKDYSSTEDNEGQLRGEQYFPQIAQNRLAWLSHSSAVVLAVQLKGRADLIPGKVVDVAIQNLDVGSDVKPNAQLSGRYIIRGSTHSFDQGVLKTNLTLAKYDWSK